MLYWKTTEYRESRRKRKHQEEIKIDVVGKFENNEQAYPHYFKDVSRYTHIDVYRVLSLWGVTCPATQHAVKKLLAAGQRGAKDGRKDLTEARDSINRALQMMDEDGE